MGHLITLPYVIYNLAAHTSVYITKGTIQAYADEDEPKMYCIKVSKTYEEAEATMQYRNHLQNCPTLVLHPPKSDMICSPIKVTLRESS